jgi:hypothetical protein
MAARLKARFEFAALTPTPRTIQKFLDVNPAAVSSEQHVAEGQYFILGDARPYDLATDTAFVAHGALVGRAEMIYFANTFERLGPLLNARP